LLGVGRDATEQETRKKYFNLAKLYHPDRHFRPEMGDMKERLETLFAAIHDAYETLIDQSKRDQYDLVLMRGTKKHGVSEETHADKPDNREIAVEQFNRGMKEFHAGNFWGAEEAFRWALRLEPGNAEYSFRLGLTLSRIPRRGHEAEGFLIKAIERAPSNIDYYLAFGEFYMKLGVKTKARALYQEALKRNPNSEKIKQAIKKSGE
jgi:curved DNA-binding protein CbpA